MNKNIFYSFEDETGIYAGYWIHEIDVSNRDWITFSFDIAYYLNEIMNKMELQRMNKINFI